MSSASGVGRSGLPLAPVCGYRLCMEVVLQLLSLVANRLRHGGEAVAASYDRAAVRVVFLVLLGQGEQQVAGRRHAEVQRLPFGGNEGGDDVLTPYRSWMVATSCRSPSRTAAMSAMPMPAPCAWSIVVLTQVVIAVFEVLVRPHEAIDWWHRCRWSNLSGSTCLTSFTSHAGEMLLVAKAVGRPK